jgi:hypothetical protein
MELILFEVPFSGFLFVREVISRREKMIRSMERRARRLGALNSAGKKSSGAFVFESLA